MVDDIYMDVDLNSISRAKYKLKIISLHYQKKYSYRDDEYIYLHHKI